MLLVKKCVVVASHPRSGTHILIDSIRRNFALFKIKLPLYSSAANLYLNIDSDRAADAFSPPRRALSRGGLVVQTHRAGLAADPLERLNERVSARQVTYLYPFRRMSKTLRGAQELCGVEGSLAAFARQPEKLLGTGLSAQECLEAHASAWLERGAVFVDIDAFVADPIEGCAALARVLGERPLGMRRPLPRQKGNVGKLSEGLERFTGRESTAVPVKRLAKPCPDEAARIDEDLASIYARMRARGVNQASLAQRGRSRGYSEPQLAAFSNA